jgi:hypothetical protein
VRTENGVEIEWWTVLEKHRIEVVSRVEVTGEVETRTHTVTTPVEVDAIEGSYPLGLDEGEQPARKSGEGWLSSQSQRGRIETHMLKGYARIDAADAPGNVVAAHSVVHTLSAKLAAGNTVLSSRHVAQPHGD